MSLTLEVKFEDSVTGDIQAVCTNYFDLGIQKEVYDQNEKEIHKIVLMFELESRNKETNKRILVNKEYAFSSSKRSNLMKDLVSWRGKPFAEGEIISFDKLIGHNAILNIIENDKGYLAIQSIKPSTNGIFLKPEYNRDFCPDYIRKKISKGRFENPVDDNAPPF